MSTPRSSRTSTWVGILLGLVVLGLLAVFAIGLPELSSDESATDAPELSLPDTLPGGYAAADDADSFADGQLADQAGEIADQQAADRKYGDRVLPSVLGTSAVTRTYVADGDKAVFVQLFASDGGAFAPNSVPAPPEADQQAGTEVKRVGDGACILTFGQASDATEAATPAFSQCQVSKDGLTVQIGSGGVAVEDLVDTADALLDDLGEDVQDQ